MSCSAFNFYLQVNYYGGLCWFGHDGLKLQLKLFSTILGTRPVCDIIHPRLRTKIQRNQRRKTVNKIDLNKNNSSIDTLSSCRLSHLISSIASLSRPNTNRRFKFLWIPQDTHKHIRGTQCNSVVQTVHILI